MEVFLRDDRFDGILSENGIVSPQLLWSLKGEDAKKKTEARQIERICLHHGSDTTEFYLKRYNPIPIREIIKNRIALKPVFTDGALHEWKALKTVEKLGIPAPKTAAAAKFADGRSCILTLGIRNYSRASNILSDPATPPQRRERIIGRIAEIAGRLHSANIAHQDLYLLHFFVTEADDDKVHLIDLQRAILSENLLPDRWLAKDLAQLLFSSKGVVTEREIALFKSEYARHVPEEKTSRLCRRIVAKADWMHRRRSRKSRTRKKSA
jgi:heptose I phosphotransferase